MVTIIKNQLLKHLSRYTKNLSPEQISLSALRGSGELADLTLDEDLLTELLELPAWLRISAASCNRASFRIQWAKLRTVPISLSLDEIHVALEVCTQPRVVTGTSASTAVPGHYSFIHKVIDGISLSVNAVRLDFSCDAFTASVQVSRLTVESRTPSWTRGDLKLTRLKNPDTGQLLIFKEMEWQTARIEARAREPFGANLTPLRLLTGQSRCRITIKKRLSDCAILASRLVLQPEPLAWALTDGQLRAAVACGGALAEPAKRATQANTRAKAERKMQSQMDTQSDGSSQNKSRSSETSTIARLFAKYNVKETSYHILAPRIDLHLCDDPGLGRSDKPSLSGGGALQVTFIRLQADFFPYHPANGDRKHWPGYREAAAPHSQWLSQALTSFRGELLEFLDPRQNIGLQPNDMTNFGDTPVHMNSNKSEVKFNVNGAPTSHRSSSGIFSSSAARNQILGQLGKLMSACLILRIDDFTVYRVTTGAKLRGPIKSLVCGEKATLPGDAGIFHAELTQFYYPGEVIFPLPSPKLYAQLSPVRVTMDSDSFVWLGAFLPHVAQALSFLDVNAKEKAESQFYMDVKMEAIMPKLVLEAGNEHLSQQRDRPKELQVSTARATLTNIREPLGPTLAGVAGSRADLANILESFQRFAQSKNRFPARPADKELIHEKFHQHALGMDDITRFGTGYEALWRSARDVWCIRAEPLWADFCGARATAGKPAPLLDAVPLTLWAYAEDGGARIWALAQLGGLAGVQINHYQMLFALRQMEKLSAMAAWLSHDARKQPGALEGSIILGALVPQAEVTLVLPSNSPGQESSRDVDSAPPDSSSLLEYRPPLESDVSAFHQELGMFAAANQGSLEGCAPLPQSPIIEDLPPPSPGGHSLNFNVESGTIELSISNNHFSGFSSVKKGWSSLVTSIDGALSRDDARSDAASTASSDSERYIIVGLSGDTPDDADTAFREWEQGRSIGNVEVAAEVMERSSSPSERSVTSSGKRRDLICTSTWRIKGVQAIYMALPEQASLKMIADNVQAEECASIPWDEFQSKFASRGRAWSENAAQSSKETNLGTKDISPRLRLRLDRVELEGNGEKNAIQPSECLSDYEEKLEVRVRNLSLSLGMSTALGLAEFAEDEITVAPMPMEVVIEDIHLHLVEDRPARNISSPSPVPLDLKLSSLNLQRDKSGVLHILPLVPLHSPDSTNPFMDSISPHLMFPFNTTSDQVQQATSLGSNSANVIGSRTTFNSALELELAEVKANEARLSKENEELKKKLFSLSNVVEDNRELRNLANSAQNEAASLLADKHAMLTTIEQLREQLASIGGWTNRPTKRWSELGACVQARWQQSRAVCTCGVNRQSIDETEQNAQDKRQRISKSNSDIYEKTNELDDNTNQNDSESQFKKLFNQARNIVLPFSFHKKEDSVFKMSDLKMEKVDETDHYTSQPCHSKDVRGSIEGVKSEVYCEVATECVEGVNYNQKHGSGFSSWWSTNRKVITSRLKLGQLARHDRFDESVDEPDLQKFVTVKPLQSSSDVVKEEDDNWFGKMRTTYPVRRNQATEISTQTDDTMDEVPVPEERPPATESNTPLPQMLFRYAACMFTGGAK